MVKVHFDVGLRAASNTSSTKVIAGENSGMILRAFVHTSCFVPLVFAVEAIACVKALQFAKDMGFQRLVLDGDSRMVIKWISNRVDHSSVTAYINDTRSLISQFLVCKVKHTLRDGNRAAHQLAKEAFDREERLFWVEEALAKVSEI
ncbi:hypothetical protein PVK06_023801 [Gossypium arboreum]|uniref:RNase H type-1 domain-containing protein n=1 Tax=Gossypium arboreum TaxID=29729 RepID=A0ABR0PC37_GOSAR|nr:hypothetical protein PVK06_023801 [Gossypium arboreum]